MTDRERDQDLAAEVFGETWAQGGGPPGTGDGMSGAMSVLVNPESGEQIWIPREKLWLYRPYGWVEVTGKAKVAEHAAKIRSLVNRIPTEAGQRAVVDQVLPLGEFGGEPRFKVDWRTVDQGDNTTSYGSNIINSKGESRDPQEEIKGHESQDWGGVEAAFPTFEVPRGAVIEEQVRVQGVNARAIQWRAATRALVEKGMTEAEAVRWLKEIQNRGGAPNEASQQLAEAVSNVNPNLAKALLDAEAPGTSLHGDITVAEQGGDEDALPDDFYIDDSFLSPPGGGGSGSRTVRTYVPPDRREVEDAVRGMLATLVGRADKGPLKEYTDLYMREDRAAFDKNDGRSPKASVLERIRAREDYKRIHRLRPDTVDEQDWVTTAMSAAINTGMTATRGAEFGVRMATAGATPQDVTEAALTQEFARTNVARPEFFNRFQETARAMFGGVR